MNTRWRSVPASLFTGSAEFIAGFREAWAGIPPDFDRHPKVRQGGRYEIGWQAAIWLKTEGVKRRPPTLSTRRLHQMNRDTGFPRIRGINA